MFVLFFVVSVTSGFTQDFLPWTDYERLRNHAEATPKDVEKDPKEIVDYLFKAAKTEREKIEIIYYWMALNITYDIKGYISGNLPNSDGLNVLKTKRAVCEGYAQLFKILCDNAKIESVVISGFAKGHGYTGERQLEANHAWNAVKLGNEWKLVDVTWGSGYVDLENDTLVFKRNLNLGYIFSKPEGFVIEHFPQDAKWQLLDKPISIDEFYSKEMDEKIFHIYRYLR